MTQINILQGTRTATDGIIHTYTHPTHHQSHTRRKKCSRTFEQSHSGTNTTVLLARSTSGPRPSPQSEIPCGGWREHTGQAQPLNTQFSRKEALSPHKSLALRCRRGAVEGFVRVLSRFVLHCAFLVPGGAVACRGQATPGHPTDPSCLKTPEDAGHPPITFR